MSKNPVDCCLLAIAIAIAVVNFIASIELRHANPTNSQVRQGIANNTKGTAFVVYEDVMDAKQACDKLNGFNFQNRYLVGT
jgi:RNA recognition motif-containing protein